MSTTSYDPSDRTRDAWTSALWADPATVAGPWTDATVEAPPGPAPAASPARRSPWPRPWVSVLVVVLAILLGIGVTRLLAPRASAQADAAPRVTAPAVPTPSPTAPATDPTPPATDPGATTPDTQPGLPPGTGQLPSQAPGSAQGSRALSAAAAAVAPSIVDITTTVGYDGGQAAGTGEVLTADGVILTNHHVIAGATAISVTVAMTGATYAADVVGYDSTHDIAVLQLRDATGLTPAPIGDSSTVSVGDAVIGLGNAGGVGGTPIEAAGSVTGLNQSITAMDAHTGSTADLRGLIETDAKIEQGDSGGSLIDAEGTVIGIITAGSVSPGTGSTTAGYAVPINQAMAIAQDIRDGKASSTVHIGATAFLGVTVASASGSGAGVLISGVVPGSAAAKAGLAAGSTVTKVDGNRVASPTDLRAALADHQPGDSVSVTWIDAAGSTRTASVTLGTGPVG